MSSPKVSCLCVTHRRRELLERAIVCFAGQTYTHRELLIFSEYEDEDTRAVAERYRHLPLKHIVFPQGSAMNLGQKRNFAIEHADGELVCTWDDDDWYHRRRIEAQVQSLASSHKPVSLLSAVLVYNAPMYLGYASSIRLWEQTVMFRKELYMQGYRYDELPKSEDRGFVQTMINHNLVYPLFCPQLYIYNFHGHNTWDLDHFSFLLKRSQLLSSEASLLMKHVMEGRLAHSEASNAIESPAVIAQIRYVS